MEPTFTWLNAMLAEPHAPAQRANRPKDDTALRRRPTRDLRRAAGHALVALGHALAGDGQRVTTTAPR